MGGRHPFIVSSAMSYEGKEMRQITRRLRIKPCHLPATHPCYNPQGAKAVDVLDSYTTYYASGYPPDDLGNVADIYVDTHDLRLYAKMTASSWAQFEDRHFFQPTLYFFAHPLLGGKVGLWFLKGFFLWTDARRKWDARPVAMGPWPSNVQDVVRKVLDMGSRRTSILESNKQNSKWKKQHTRPTRTRTENAPTIANAQDSLHAVARHGEVRANSIDFLILHI